MLFPLVRTFARIRVEGGDLLKDLQGPFVIVANHSSHFDCPVILAALPHRIRHRTIVAAAADYFYKVQALGALTSLALGTVPFERHDSARESLGRLKEALLRGWSVLIFPEGTRSASGTLGKFRLGASYLSVDTKTAALPTHIEGAYDILPKGRRWPRRGPVRVRFGAPVGPRPDDDYQTFTKRLRRVVAELGEGD